MNYKYNKKYFTSSPLPTVVGVILILGGAILFVALLAAGGRRGMYAAMSALIPVIAGAVILAFFKGGHSNEGDFDAATEKVYDRVEQKAAEKHGLIKDKADKFDLNPEKKWRMIDPFNVGGYLFNEGEIYVKRGNDGKYRTSTYKGGIMLFGYDRVYIYTNTFSFCDENFEPVEDIVQVFYDDLKSMEVKFHNFSNDKISADYTLLHIYKKDGTDVFQVPVPNDAAVDNMITELFRRIKTMEAQKRAREQGASNV
ncbi:MAG: DUF308 domain-containing protein [Clostridiales bacterium]|nr:DUF308 domain-containing protein [Clostridiales bacterium]